MSTEPNTCEGRPYVLIPKDLGRNLSALDATLAKTQGWRDQHFAPLNPRGPSSAPTQSKLAAKQASHKVSQTQSKLVWGVKLTAEASAAVRVVFYVHGFVHRGRCGVGFFVGGDVCFVLPRAADIAQGLEHNFF